MSSNRMRVMLASDQPDIRRQLESVVEQNLGGVVVGEGENAIKALRLARQLRPDMAIIDSYLPHNIALSDIAMSRNSGLDAAQAIHAEIPGMRVVVVNSGIDSSYPLEMEPLVLWPALSGAAYADSHPGISFANLQARYIPRKRPGFSNICMAVGTCGLLAGLVLTASMILAYIGLPLLVIGAASLFTGCVGKLVASLRFKETGPVYAGEGSSVAGTNKEDQDGK